MKKLFFFLLFTTFAAITINAQVPDDALRNAWFIPGGTARYVSIGGALGSLGGDITANNINPAGIGLYKTREIVITPGVMMNNNKFDYRGENSNQSKTAFAYGATGIILGTPKPTGYTWTSSAFSVSVNQLASFNNHTYYKGFNNVSSFSEQYLEELIRDNASPDAANANYIFGSSLAFRTYLIDTLSNTNGDLIGYKTLVPISSGTIQERDEKTTGGYHEISIAFAGNLADKLYLGTSINIPVVSYTRDLWYKETDATTDTSNNFSSFQYNEHFTSSGVGINLKLGMIYKIKEGFRLGFALHSPSFIGFKDQIRSDMTTNTEAYAGLRMESSDNLNSGNPGERSYNLLTPWRFIASGSYVFNAVEDTKKQKGFISGDIEYITYGSARFYSTDNQDQTGKDYYTSLNSTVKDYYKGSFNFRLGGEIKFDPIAVRLGGAYYGSPYNNTTLKAHRIMAAGGLGYRKHGYFVDLTYARTFNKDVSFPYLLNDKPNTYADWNNSRGNIIITVGFKI
jgi:hypothetical protein